MKKLLSLGLMLASSVLGSQLHAQSTKTLFYLGDGRVGVEDFLAHKDKIDIISPTWYSIDENGLVTGEPQPVVLRAAHEAHIQVFPIFALFDKDKLHQLANDPRAQDAMNAAFIRECKENGYDGIQYDIEDVMWTDRDALSAMVKKTADLLHAQHLQVQIAVVPNAPGHAGSTAFGKWIYEEWRGGYDLKALGESVDLLCLMTYDQHTRWTEPGPVGGWVWTNDNLKYALQFVPREKLSLGISLYGYHWFTGDPGLNEKTKKPNPQAEYISQPNAIYLRDTYGGKEQWDEFDHSPFFWFYRDQMREWVFYTNERAFHDRYMLANDNHLAGICSWVLGEEDPAIWNSLPSRK